MANRIFNIEQTVFETSVGQVALPIFYQDVGTVQAYYWVDPKNLAPLLLKVGLAPVVFFNGMALAGFGAFAYRRSDIGPYNEVGLGVIASPLVEEKRRLPLLEQLLPPRAIRRAGRTAVPVSPRTGCPRRSACAGASAVQ